MPRERRNRFTKPEAPPTMDVESSFFVFFVAPRRHDRMRCSHTPSPPAVLHLRVPLLMCTFLVPVDERSLALSLLHPCQLMSYPTTFALATFSITFLSSACLPLPLSIPRLIPSSVCRGGLIDGSSCCDELGPVAAVFFGGLYPSPSFSRAHIRLCRLPQSLPAATALFLMRQPDASCK